MSGIAAHAMKYLDVPFRHRGRSVRGLDCLGLIVLASQDAGKTVQDKKVYGREPWRDGLREGLRANLGAPLDRPPQVDDILLMRLRPDAEPSHVAIVAPYNLAEGTLGLIHTYANVGKVCHHSMDAIWSSRVDEVYAWPA